MKTFLVPLACVGLALCLSAAAQDAPAPAPAGQGVRAACAADFKKFCSDVQPGDGRIRACIAAHKDDLSPGCRDALAQAHLHRPQPQGATGESPTPPPPKPQQ
jgi:Cysteine rich repeat